MNKPLLAVACALLGGSLCAQSTLFVSPTGSDDGSSWTSSSSLKDALHRAKPGDQVWLTQGTYPTSNDGNRDVYFDIPEGVRLLGGFAGREKNASGRNPRDNKTILTGEIGKKERSDNAYTVVRIADATASTTLDGLTITGAYANGHGPTADPRRAGGGVLVKVTNPKASSQPTLINCNIVGNYARDGGGVYVDGQAGKAKPSFVNCTFEKNEADLDGGAIYNDGRRRGEASPSFVDCTFDSNVANYGGAIFNQATKGKSSPKLSKCDFRQNHAYVRGATLYNLAHQGENRPVLIDCVFEELDQSKDDSSSVARGN
ncbi:MAG: DUF1565 domain-containing protein [Saprospiraceae bacterium]